jgi:N-acyl-D-amino-acid deacylase
MLARPPDVAPGAKYVYSNFGYCLLGRVIARASGQPYEKYVRQRVLAPLEMKSTQLGNSLRAAADEATYYAQPQVLSQGVVPGVLGKRVETQYGGWNLELLDANGGWISTASDLAKFASAFDGRRDWISPKVLATMHSPLPAERDKAPYYYAHGWLVRPVPGRGANIWHNGALLGTSSLLVRRHDGLCWAVLFNSRDDKDGNLLSSTIDPLIYRALDRIELQPAE